MQKLLLFALVAAFMIVTIAFNFIPAIADIYYKQQTNFDETSVPMANYRWTKDNIQGCIYMENTVPDPYYVWAKLAIQQWREALKEYTGNQKAWNITAHYVKSKTDLELCDVKIYIYASYKDFPSYPMQTGAYTKVSYMSGEVWIVNDVGLDARVYLAPFVLHGDGKTEINLPHYAFRNSAVHEIGHVLGLGHMHSQKGYLMSPQFDFWQQKAQFPITTLELRALVKAYGTDGFG
jgi:hypothetical protein